MMELHRKQCPYSTTRAILPRSFLILTNRSVHLPESLALYLLHIIAVHSDMAHSYHMDHRGDRPLLNLWKDDKAPPRELGWVFGELVLPLQQGPRHGVPYGRENAPGW